MKRTAVSRQKQIINRSGTNETETDQLYREKTKNNFFYKNAKAGKSEKSELLEFEYEIILLAKNH